MLWLQLPPGWRERAVGSPAPVSAIEVAGTVIDPRELLYDSLEAEMIKDLLESGEIPVVLRSSKVSPYPVNVGKIGEIKILVNDNDKEIAEKLINEDIDID